MLFQRVKPFFEKHYIQSRSKQFPCFFIKAHFCQNFPKLKINQIEGVLKPKIKSMKTKSSPKNELFYGVPLSKQIPKSKEDLIGKIDYQNSYDDMMELFESSSAKFDGEIFSIFLERLNLILLKELRIEIHKAKEQQFLFKTEKDITEEHNQKINILLEDISIFVEEKNFNFREILLTYFQVLNKLKKEIPSKFVEIIFEESKKEENFDNLRKEDLIKLSFILSRHRLLFKTKADAEEGLLNLANKILEIGFENLSKDELYELLYNLSFNKVFPNLEFYTHAEPHLLKYIQEYSPRSLVNIFIMYVKNLLGSNFFIQTVGFSLVSNLNNLSLKDLILLFEVTDKRYYNRPELSIKFFEMFMNIFSYIPPYINTMNAKEITIILKAMISTGYNDKKFLHLLSTIYLKYADKEEFQRLVYTFYYFSVLDLENVIFAKKILEVLSLNILCINHYMEGNQNLDSLQGVYDKDFLKKLNFLARNVASFKDRLIDFEKIKFNEDELFSILDCQLKTLWSVTYFMSKENLVNNLDNFKEFLNKLIKLFNNFVSNIKASEDSGVRVKMIKTNVEKILQAYFFLLLHSKKLDLKNNINIEFLKLQNLELVDNNEEIYDYANFSIFKQKIKEYLVSASEMECLEVEYEEDFSDIGNYDVFKFLKCDFVRIKENPDNGKKTTELIFINNPYDYFEVSMNYTGYNKFRKNLCGLINLKFIEIDYSEFMIFYKDIKINEENYQQLVQDFISLKLN